MAKTGTESGNDPFLFTYKQGFFCVRIDVFIFTLYYSYNVSDVWKAFNCEKKVSVLANHQGFSIIRFYPQFGLVSFLIRFTIK